MSDERLLQLCRDFADAVRSGLGVGDAFGPDVEIAAHRRRDRVLSPLTERIDHSGILTYLGQSTEWPVMTAARPPPEPAKDETQLDAEVDGWDGIQGA